MSTPKTSATSKKTWGLSRIVNRRAVCSALLDSQRPSSDRSPILIGWRWKETKDHSNLSVCWFLDEVDKPIQQLVEDVVKLIDWHARARSYNMDRDWLG